jgi:hypothetical protein
VTAKLIGAIGVLGPSLIGCSTNFVSVASMTTQGTEGAYAAAVNGTGTPVRNLVLDCRFVREDGSVQNRRYEITELPAHHRVDIRSDRQSDRARRASCQPTKETVASAPVPIAYSP